MRAASLEPSAASMADSDRPFRWWQFRKRRHCPHVRVIGVYGDDIRFAPGNRRNYCCDCGRWLDGPVSIAGYRDLLREPGEGADDARV